MTTARPIASASPWPGSNVTLPATRFEIAIGTSEMNPVVRAYAVAYAPNEFANSSSSEAISEGVRTGIATVRR